MKGLFVLLSTLFLLFSCQVKSQLVLDQDDSGTLTNTIELAPFFEEFFFDIFERDPLLEEIQNSLINHGTLDNIELSSQGNHFDNRFHFDHIQDLPGLSEGMLQLTQQGANKELNIVINRENWEQLELLIPLLQDPSLSYLGPRGSEGMSRSEFREMLIYPFVGYASSEEEAADSLDWSTFYLQVEVPGNIMEIDNGEKLNPHEALFEVPLFDLLMLDRELVYRLTYH